MLRKTADAIRFLSMDAVRKANSGHPGAPMGLADLMSVLWKNQLKHNPNNPTWINRDRFVLSNGHASMLLYSTLHLSGYDLSIDDLKNFRQLHSATPGHPELCQAKGIETTTGPLAQGFASAVGMAIAEKTLASQFNKKDLKVVNHHTFVIVGDGCLMEGLNHEAASLAGVLKLNKLIVLWDDNGISIDGKLVSWQNENVVKRFRAYGFKVIRNIDGHNLKAVNEAIKQAKKSNKPTFIQCKTQMAYGSELANNPKAHGSPLNEEQIANTRKTLGWDYAAFEIPKSVYQFFNHNKQGQKEQEKWDKLFNQYLKKYPSQAAELLRRSKNKLPSDFNHQYQKIIEKVIFEQTKKIENGKAISPIATRSASQQSLEYLANLLPELFGGSADLTPSNLTNHSKSIAINLDSRGNYCHYGVREFAMVSAMNGIDLHGGFLPYGGTFLVFSDYARGAIRLAALMKTRVICIFTHDSIGVGEDGPTHQPIEHIASLRLIPNLNVFRPADLIETMVSWKVAINSQSPTVLALSRQALPCFPHTKEQISLIEKGAYIIYQPNFDERSNKKIAGLIIATGSEVSIAIEVAKKYNDEGIYIQVVSMPCVDEFLKQSKEYQQTILPEKIDNRLVIEAGVTSGWERFAGKKGAIIGIDSFGVSAPGKQVYDYYGITIEKAYLKLSEILES